MSSQPSVFVSSTIYDFHDLRSALKSWLGELGYDAQLSEFNDFPKQLDTDSYTACFDAIRKADYYVLLIGKRVGAWYDEENGISVTRQEYREAYKSFLATGRPRIVSLVRTDVRTVYAERKDLAKFFESEAAREEGRSDEAKETREHAELRASGKNLWLRIKSRAGFRAGDAKTAAKVLSRAPSKHVEDAAAIGAFIEEVGREEEMRKATKDSERPPGNWVHQFHTFEDVIDVLRREFRVGSVRRSVLEANLGEALTEIAHALSEAKGTYGPRFATHLRVADMRKKVAERYGSIQTLDQMSASRMSLSPKDSMHAAAFWLTGRRELPTSALEECARSGEFHFWIPSRHRFGFSKVQQAITRLLEEIALLRSHCTAAPKIPDEVFDWRTLTHDVEFRFQDLLVLAHMHDRHANILDLAAAIDAALNKDESLLEELELYEHSGEGRRAKLLQFGADDIGAGILLMDRKEALAVVAKEKKAARTAATAPSSAPPQPGEPLRGEPLRRHPSRATTATLSGKP